MFKESNTSLSQALHKLDLLGSAEDTINTDGDRRHQDADRSHQNVNRDMGHQDPDMSHQNVNNVDMSHQGTDGDMGCQNGNMRHEKVDIRHAEDIRDDVAEQALADAVVAEETTWLWRNLPLVQDEPRSEIGGDGRGEGWVEGGERARDSKGVNATGGKKRSRRGKVGSATVVPRCEGWLGWWPLDDSLCSSRSIHRKDSTCEVRGSRYVLRDIGPLSMDAQFVTPRWLRRNPSLTSSPTPSSTHARTASSTTTWSSSSTRSDGRSVSAISSSSGSGSSSFRGQGGGGEGRISSVRGDSDASGQERRGVLVGGGDMVFVPIFGCLGASALTVCECVCSRVCLCLCLCLCLCVCEYPLQIIMFPTYLHTTHVPVRCGLSCMRARLLLSLMLTCP